MLCVNVKHFILHPVFSWLFFYQFSWYKLIIYNYLIIVTYFVFDYTFLYKMWRHILKSSFKISHIMKTILINIIHFVKIVLVILSYFFTSMEYIQIEIFFPFLVFMFK